METVDCISLVHFIETRCISLVQRNQILQCRIFKSTHRKHKSLIKQLILKKKAKQDIDKIRHCPLRLEKLSVDNFFDSKLNANLVIDFLRQQSETLLELEIKNPSSNLILRRLILQALNSRESYIRKAAGWN